MEKSAMDLIKEVESDTKNLRWGYLRAKKFIEALRIFEEKGDKINAQKMSWEADLFRAQTTNRLYAEKKQERFLALGPIIDDALDHYAERAERIKNPIHKARYCDIIWEKRREHLFAKKAIDAYLDCIPIYLDNDWQREIADCLQRSTELALSLNDNKLIKRVKEKILSTMGILVDSKKFRYCLELIGSLKETKKRVDVIDFEKAINMALDGAKYYENEVKDGFSLQRGFLEKIIELYGILGENEKVLEFKYKVAYSYEKEAKWKLHNYPSGNSVAAHFYQEALNEYRKLGVSKNRKKIDELKTKIKEHNKKAVESEMKVISVSFKIPSRLIEETIKKLAKLSTQDSLEQIAKNNSLIPNIQHLREQTKREKKGSSISYLFSRTSMRNANVVARSVTDEEIFEDHLIRRINMHYTFNYVFLGKILDYLRAEKGLDAKTLIQYLSHSDIFEKENLEIIEIGFDRYFKGDYVSTIHVLVPQMEDILRKTLLRIGLPTTSIHRENIMYEKTLDDVLRTDELKTKLGEGFWYYLKVFLVDKRGENLRNDVAHGLLKLPRCTKEVTEILIHQFIVLTRYNFPQNESR